MTRNEPSMRLSGSETRISPASVAALYLEYHKLGERLTAAIIEALAALPIFDLPKPTPMDRTNNATDTVPVAPSTTESDSSPESA